MARFLPAHTVTRGDCVRPVGDRTFAGYVTAIYGDGERVRVRWENGATESVETLDALIYRTAGHNQDFRLISGTATPCLKTIVAGEYGDEYVGQCVLTPGHDGDCSHVIEREDADPAATVSTNRVGTVEIAAKDLRPGDHIVKTSILPTPDDVVTEVRVVELDEVVRFNSPGDAVVAWVTDSTTVGRIYDLEQTVWVRTGTEAHRRRSNATLLDSTGHTGARAVPGPAVADALALVMEMDDDDLHAYGAIHRAGCRDVGDPETLGSTADPTDIPRLADNVTGWDDVPADPYVWRVMPCAARPLGIPTTADGRAWVSRPPA